MTPEQFVFWLQGHFEMNPDLATLNEVQVALVKQHLQLVFKHAPNVDGLAHGEVVTPLQPFGPIQWSGQVYC